LEQDSILEELYRELLVAFVEEVEERGRDWQGVLVEGEVQVAEIVGFAVVLALALALAVALAASAVIEKAWV
jgi:hypothetical protein